MTGNSRYPLDIIHVRLDQDFPDFPHGTNGRGLYLVLWWKNIPLGHLTVPNQQVRERTVLKRQMLSAISPALDFYRDKNKEGKSLDYKEAWTGGNFSLFRQALADIFRDTGKAAPVEEVSLVICTRNRAEMLRKCLASAMNLAPGPVEIIVVDNAPEDDATEMAVADFKGVKYLREPRPGLDKARNTGARAARGSIVAFTDDDVRVHKAWVGSIARAFSDKRTMAMTGLVIAAELQTEEQLIFEQHWSFNRGYVSKQYDQIYFKRTVEDGVPAWEFGAGANMAFRKEIFERIGYFDERLDVGAAGCSGDSEYWYRILAEGWQCQYEPRAVVFHTHRADIRGLRRQLHFYMRGFITALLIQYARYRHKGNIRRILDLPGYYLFLFARGLPGGYKFRYRTLFSEVTGCLSGLKYYMRHRNDTNW